MGIPVLIIGESGSGKSTSLRNFEPDEIGILNVVGKRLPFRKPLKTLDCPNYNTIISILRGAKSKAYAIDDSQYLMCNEFFSRASEKGYDKFTDIGVHFKSLIDTVLFGMPKDAIVYFLHHSEADDKTEKIKAKTIGKMLNEKLTLEGLFTIVLLCIADDTGHSFVTQSGGYSVAKSPMDMFEMKIDNDLKLVDTTIREYYGMASLTAPAVPAPASPGPERIKTRKPVKISADNGSAVIENSKEDRAK